MGAMTLAGVHPDLENFCAPWLEREPQLLLACQFAPSGGLRERFLATQVLLRELTEAAVGVSAVRVAEVKLMWWLDEAAAWASGHPRHPLAHGFEAQVAAPELAVLVRGVLEWVEAPSPASMLDVDGRLAGFGEQLARLCDAPADASHWRLCWFIVALRLSGGAAQLATVVPLDLLARHGRRRSDWTQADPQLIATIVAECAAGYPRIAARADSPAMRALAVIEQRWLQRLASGTELAALRVRIGDAFAAWRAARA
jgi:hypothetical protein